MLLQVTLDDAAQADELFSVLMGEDVESRRSFITRNAKDVRFLDLSQASMITKTYWGYDRKSLRDHDVGRWTAATERIHVKHEPVLDDRFGC